jgi:hypothetical protein
MLLKLLYELLHCRIGKRIESAFKSLLGKSGYSDKASNEVWKWYRSPPKKSKAVKKWHSRARLIDLRKTRLTIIKTEVTRVEDNEILT